MQTLKFTDSHGTACRYTLSPTCNAGELQSKLAKCNGKYKPTKIKDERRLYPAFKAGDSTREYVRVFEMLNGSSRGAQLITKGFYEPEELNDDPCTLYSGEDTHETIECEALEFPHQELLAA